VANVSPFFGPYVVTQPFMPGPGWLEPGHTGVDVVLQDGETISSGFTSGVLEERRNVGGFGNEAIIHLANGGELIFGHLARFLRGPGPIGAGTAFGLEGSSGYSTGKHVHFEEDVAGKPVNPTAALVSGYIGALPSAPGAITPILLTSPDPNATDPGAGVKAVADALTAGGFDAGQFLQTQVVALAVAAVVLIAVFKK
jgi:murein DD-endopeptidase MepM/ murein hydrolase activator NlpD